MTDGSGSAGARPRALVLAAGLGTRLRPLTAATPKPLLPVRGRPILEHTLLLLAAAGCEAAAVNLHHHGEQIRRALGGAIAGMPLVWSEEPVLLGTLGALGPLVDFCAGADPLLLVNGDSLCRWPFAALLRRHREQGALATLLLASRADLADFSGGIAVARGGAIVSLRPAAGGAAPAAPVAGGPAGGPAVRRQVFAGVHALSPRILPEAVAALAKAAGPPVDIVRQLYEPLLAARPGCIASLATGRRWHDMGTPRRFLAASLDWAGPRGWISKDAAVAAGAGVARSSLEAGCVVAGGAVVEESVLLPGASAGAGCRVRGSILGPGARLPAGGSLENQLLVAGGEPIAL